MVTHNRKTVKQIKKKLNKTCFSYLLLNPFPHIFTFRYSSKLHTCMYKNQEIQEDSTKCIIYHQLIEPFLGEKKLVKDFTLEHVSYNSINFEMEIAFRGILVSLQMYTQPYS